MFELDHQNFNKDNSHKSKQLNTMKRHHTNKITRNEHYEPQFIDILQNFVDTAYLDLNE